MKILGSCIFVIIIMYVNQALGQIKLDGLAVSFHRWNECPGILEPTNDELQGDIEFLKQSRLTNKIRIYSTQGPNSTIPALAKKLGLELYQGAWLTNDANTNDLEIQNLISIANNNDCKVAIVGSEVLLRNQLTSDELIKLLDKVRQSIPKDVPVAYSDIPFIWQQHPDLADHVDQIFVHIYPFWEDVSIDQAVSHTVDEYHSMASLFPMKKIIIGETGWPGYGQSMEVAIPSMSNYRRYLQEFSDKAKLEGIEYFWFSAFDERWKFSDGEGMAGEHWGLFKTNRTVKPELSDIIAQPVIPIGSDERKLFDRGVLAWGYDLSIDDSAAKRDWLSQENDLFKISYPNNLSWGIIQMRPIASRINGSKNGCINPEDEEFTQFSTLLFDAKSDRFVQEPMRVGMLDWSFNQNGMEPIDIIPYLTTDWQQIVVPLDFIRSVDLSHINIPIEFSFFGPQSVNVQIRNIRMVTKAPTEGGIQVIAPRSPLNQTLYQREVFMGRALRPPYLDVLVDSAPSHLKSWFNDGYGYFKLDFPSNQQWALMGIYSTCPSKFSQTHGAEDLGSYQTLSFATRAPKDLDKIYVGMKACDEPDDGQEPRIKLVNTVDRWRMQIFPLSLFSQQAQDPSSFLNKSYLLPEFISLSNISQTLLIRDISFMKSLPVRSSDKWIYKNGVVPGYAFCQSSGENSTMFLNENNGTMQIKYVPKKMDWGMAYLLDGTQNCTNIEPYQSLSLDLKSILGPNTVNIGIKDIADPNDGMEERVQCYLSGNWETFDVPLHVFLCNQTREIDIKKIKVPFEVIFKGDTTQEIAIRNVRFTREPWIPSGPSNLTKGNCIEPGYILYANTSSGKANWINAIDDYFRIQYPGEYGTNAWGSVGITAMSDSGYPRRCADFSCFDAVQFKVRGLTGGGNLYVHLKTNTDPDDGLESRIAVGPLTDQWRQVSLPLSSFKSANLSNGLRRLYNIISFDFQGAEKQTVDLKDISFTRDSKSSVKSYSEYN